MTRKQAAVMIFFWLKRAGSGRKSLVGRSGESASSQTIAAGVLLYVRCGMYIMFQGAQSVLRSMRQDRLHSFRSPCKRWQEHQGRRAGRHLVCMLVSLPGDFKGRNPIVVGYNSHCGSASALWQDYSGVPGTAQ